MPSDHQAFWTAVGAVQQKRIADELKGQNEAMRRQVAAAEENTEVMRKQMEAMREQMETMQLQQVEERRARDIESDVERLVTQEQAVDKLKQFSAAVTSWVSSLPEKADSKAMALPEELQKGSEYLAALLTFLRRTKSMEKSLTTVSIGPLARHKLDNLANATKTPAVLVALLDELREFRHHVTRYPLSEFEAAKMTVAKFLNTGRLAPSVQGLRTAVASIRFTCSAAKKFLDELCSCGVKVASPVISSNRQTAQNVLSLYSSFWEVEPANAQLDVIEKALEFRNYVEQHPLSELETARAAVAQFVTTGRIKPSTEALQKAIATLKDHLATANTYLAKSKSRDASRTPPVIKSDREKAQQIVSLCSSFWQGEPKSQQLESVESALTLTDYFVNVRDDFQRTLRVVDQFNRHHGNNDRITGTSQIPAEITAASDHIAEVLASLQQRTGHSESWPKAVCFANNLTCANQYSEAGERVLEPYKVTKERYEAAAKRRQEQQAKIMGIGCLLVIILLAVVGFLANEEEKAEKANPGQKQRAALCARLLSDLRAEPKVTPSASVAKLLGNDYAVELRGGPDAIDLGRLANAQAAKDWLKVLSVLEKEPVTTYPDEGGIKHARNEFLTHKFLVFVKTPLDLSRTSILTLSDTKWEVSDGNLTVSVDSAYINGMAMYGTGGRRCEPANLRWERHPDSAGWYFTWQPIDGEVILVPNVDDLDHDTNARRILSQVAKIGPVVYSHGSEGDGGLLGTLMKKLKLGEVTEKQISEAVDAACLERFQARRKALLAL